jgi:bifunctional enzyme CysN/CysC
MAQRAELVETLPEFVTADQGRGLLRFLTCGSVDDGKSTLIGRLLYDSKRLFEDQLATLRSDSDKYGTDGSNIDFALLVDGLQAEREQGITIDVAYRFFATDRRRFIVADTPGHVQYTRNMATGASTADLAILLVNAQAGILTQTRRHAFIVSLLGIRHVVLAVNKIDLVGHDEARFNEIRDAFAAFAEPLNFAGVQAIPMSARHGDNVIEPRGRTPWYKGPSLLEYLETVEIESRAGEALRLPVQWVNRPNASFRGYCGTIAAGSVKPGDTFVVSHTGQIARVAKIVSRDGDLNEAVAGDAVTITADREIDISRGDVLAPPDARPDVSDQVAAHILWMSDEPLLPGRSYLLKAGSRTTGAAVTELKHQVDIEDTFKPLAAKTLGLNDIGLCNLSLSEPIAFDPYDENRATGSFILIDRFSNATVAAGMIRFGLRRATNIHWQALDVNKRVRAEAKGQKPVILWFTGLSGAGKSTIANLVERKLNLAGKHTYLLDGDNVRHGLNRDLGFTDADRVENIRRVAEAAKLFVDAGLIVLVSFISPFRSERDAARELVEAGEFLEVYVDAPLAVAEERDPKGLYKKARAGEIQNFTGIDSPYEAPLKADIHLDTTAADAEALAEQVVERLKSGGYLGRS